MINHINNTLENFNTTDIEIEFSVIISKVNVLSNLIMNYVNILPSDLQIELYCYLPYGELCNSSQTNENIRKIVHTEHFLQRKKVPYDISYAQYHDFVSLVRIVTDMIMQKLYEIKQTNSHKPSKQFIICHNSHPPKRILCTGANIYCVLYDYLQYFNASFLGYGNYYRGHDFDKFVYCLLWGNSKLFTLDNLIEYIKISAIQSRSVIHITEG
jgi:hypothetical protein